MRPDMNEVLIERPRSGMRIKTRRNNKPRAAEYIDEDSYGRELRPTARRTKWFDDHLGPLRRWLRAQINRPWDKVWSELCAGIDQRSVTGRHLLDHARREVDIDCTIGADGKIYPTTNGWLFRTRDPVAGLYVHPRTGLLRWQKPESARQRRARTAGKPPEVALRRVDAGQFLWNDRGIWYRLRVDPVLQEDPPETQFAHFEFERVRFRILDKRQLTQRQLREHGLANAA